MREVSWGACAWSLLQVTAVPAGMAFAGHGSDWNKMLCPGIPPLGVTHCFVAVSHPFHYHIFFSFFFLFLFVECSWDQRTQKVRPLWPIYQCQGVYFAVSISLHHHSKLHSRAPRCNNTCSLCSCLGKRKMGPLIYCGFLSSKQL